MELIQVANLINGRYILSDYKKDKKEILNSQLLASYSVDKLGVTNIEVVYFDTPDFFFAEKGINVYTSTYGNTKELVVCYDESQVTRVEFLRNIPNFYKMNIGKKDNISKYYDKINEAIHKVFPTGLNVNVEDILRNAKPQVIIEKKRDSYRVVNNQGLRLTVSFDQCKYININKKQKDKGDTLDIVAEGFKAKEDFDTFLKYVIRDFPQLLKTNNNELALVRKNF